MVNINLPADGYVFNFLATGDASIAWPSAWFLVLIVVNLDLITCDDPLQKVVIFFAIMN
jgi:hypothetical protein